MYTRTSAKGAGGLLASGDQQKMLVPALVVLVQPEPAFGRQA